MSVTELTRTQNYNLIVWNGHLCEGDQMIPNNRDTFILWTRCGKHDVPANKGYEGDISEVTCTECRGLAGKE